MNKPKEQPEGSHSETRITITTHWRHSFLIVQLGTLSQRHACVWTCSLISEYIRGERRSCENVFMVTQSAELNDAFFDSVRKFRQLVACWVCAEWMFYLKAHLGINHDGWVIKVQQSNWLMRYRSSSSFFSFCFSIHLATYSNVTAYCDTSMVSDGKTVILWKIS